MNILKKYLFTLGYSLFFLSFSLKGQPSQIIPTINDSVRYLFHIHEHDLSYDGKSYRLYIAQPNLLTKSPRPILYMLDGNGQFPVLMNEIKKTSSRTPLIVAIGYPSQQAYPKERTRDYTVPIKGNRVGGGAEKFYQFLIEKVKPFIEKRYHPDTVKQTLCGHSHGGQFVLYVAFEHTDSFQNYVAGSPSLWWGKNKVIPNRVPIFSTLPKSITLTQGEYEANPKSKSRQREQNPVKVAKHHHLGGMPLDDLASLLSREVSSTRIIIYKGKNHGSSIPLFLIEALRVAADSSFKN